MRRILFVCTGNTCRSPMAAALLADAVQRDAALREAAIELRSAGIDASPGDPPTPLAVEIMKCHGLELGRHRATRLTQDLIECADPILTMTGGHKDRIRGRSPEAASKMFTVTGDVGGSGDVEDPLYRGTEEAYERCAGQLGAQIPRILEKLRAVNGRVERKPARSAGRFTRRR